MMEAGFVQKWLSDIEQQTKILEISQEGMTQSNLIDLPKLQGAAVALAVGYLIGLLALIIELLHWKYVILKNPTFNKYHMDEFYKNNVINI